MKSRYAIVLAVALCAAGSARAGISRWPLNEPRKLSSSFGEYRDGHYHAGVDLRTFGRIGLPCIAPDSCEAVRIRVSPVGYGKALYVRLRDGRTAVYAHLNGFSRALDSLSYHWRLERGENSCDFEIAGGRIRFAPGETVAYTGTSGSPHPHLHFEMRDAGGRPFNPLVGLYEVPDACPPIISALEIVPLSWGSLVDGSPVPCTRRFRLSKGSRFVLDGTLRLDGLIGFGVDAYDKQLRGSYRMGPYSVELLIDGETAYRVRNRTFDYSRSGDIALEYEDRGGDAAGRFFILFRKPDNEMPDREGWGVVTNDTGRAAAVVLPPGLHRGEIVVCDAAGNEARGSFQFVLKRSPLVEAKRRISSGAPRIEIDAFDPDGGSVSTDLAVSTDGGAAWSAVALEEAPGSLVAAASPDSGALYRCVVRDGMGAETSRFFGFPDPRAGGDSVYCDASPELRAEGLYLRIRTDRALASIPSVRRSAGREEIRSACFKPARGTIAFAPAARLASGVNVFTIRGGDHRGYPLERVCAFRIFMFGSGSSASFDSGDGSTIRLEAPSARGAAALMVSDAPDPGRKFPGLEQVSAPFSLEFPLEGFARPLRCGFDSGRAAGLTLERKGRVAVRRGASTGGEHGRRRKPGRLRGIRRRGGAGPEEPRVYPSDLGKRFFQTQALLCSRRRRRIRRGRRIGDGDSERSARRMRIRRVPFQTHDSDSRVVSAGPARLRVEVSDRSGNRNSAEFGFVIE